MDTMDTITVIDPTKTDDNATFELTDELTDEAFISIHVPEAAEMSFEEALKLALERNDIAAGEFEDSVTMAEATAAETEAK